MDKIITLVKILLSALPLLPAIVIASLIATGKVYVKALMDGKVTVQEQFATEKELGKPLWWVASFFCKVEERKDGENPSNSAETKVF